MNPAHRLHQAPGWQQGGDESRTPWGQQPVAGAWAPLGSIPSQTQVHLGEILKKEENKSDSWVTESLQGVTGFTPVAFTQQST